MNCLTLIFPIVLIVALVLLFIKYLRAGSAPEIMDAGSPARSFFGTRYRCNREDLLPVAIITAVCAVISFWGLGSTKAPESFLRLESGTKAVIDMGEVQNVSKFMYYTGIFTGDYSVETSVDGENWSYFVTMPQEYSKLLRWLPLDPFESESDSNSDSLNKIVINPDGSLSPQSGYRRVRYIRITSSGTLMMGELAIYDKNGQLINSDNFSYMGGADALFDEQSVIPSAPSYLNGSYFDEIYHVRTAYEHYLGEKPYEITHPPLGKLIIMCGIAIWGLNPFGWRFMGTLFGVLLIPLLYVFIKNIFGKRKVAIFGTLLLAFDFMRYTQTRLATIDTYTIFFILLMYLFMFRWITNDYDAPEKKHLPSLILSGLFFGIGVCCKWQCLYAGAGLAIIYSIYLIKRCLWRKRNGIPYAKELFDILLISLLFFIIVPVILYSLCYIPYAVGGQNFSLDIVIDNQKYMFNYHSGVTATHSYGSRWWQWILDLRPILYYLQTPKDGYRSSFAAFGNPVLYWGGLLALICIAVRFFRHRDGRIAFIIIGWAAQILPWIFISRVSFAYHYFPAELFLVLALCWVANDWTERDKFGSRLMFISLPTASIILFVLFYPVLSGVAVLKKFSYNVLKWFPSWPF